MANKKEFEYIININTAEANQNLKASVNQINITGKSIAELNKELRRQMAVFKQLTAEQRNSDIGKQVQKNIQAIQNELKNANSAIKTTSQSAANNAKEVGNTVKEAFNFEKITKSVEKLGNALEFQSLEQGFDNVADAIGDLDPRLKIVAEVGKKAFREILESIKLTEGGTRSLQGTFGGLKEALTLRNIASLLSLPLAFANARKIAKDFREGELAALKKFDLERENVLRNSAIAEIELIKNKNQTILNDETKSFSEQAEALKKNLNLELQASAERITIATNELEIFKQQKEVRKLIEARGSDFVKELNSEQLAQYQGIQDKIKQATNERVIAQIEYEQEYRRLYRQEQERLLQIFVANQNRIIDANNFKIENERISLGETLKLLESNYKKRADIINAELNILDKNNKEDAVKFVQLNNEKISLQREFEKQKEQVIKEFAQREISLQEAKNQSIIEINNKYNELFKGTLDEQIQRIKDNTELQLNINEQKIKNLDAQDKEYLIKLQQLENERQKIIAESNEAIIRQSLAFYDNQLQELQRSIEISTKTAQIKAAELSSDVESELQNILAEIDKLNKESATNVIKAIKNYDDLKKAQENAYQARIQQLQIQADIEKKQNEAQIQYNNAQIQRLQKELELGDQISEVRKKQIQQEIELLKLSTQELQGRQTQIDVKLNIDAKQAKNELDEALKGINKQVIDSLQASISKVNDGFKIISEFFTTAIDLQLQTQLNAIEAQQASIDEFLSNNEKAIEKVSELESNATGARQRRLQKERKELEKLQKQEIERKEELEKQKIEAERKAKEKAKIFQIGQVLIDTAAGIVNAVAKFPETFGLPFSAFVAATGALQLAAINAVKFAKGGIIRYDKGGNIAFSGGYVPIGGGMIEGLSHAEGGVKFNMGNAIGEADGRKGEAYIINTKNNPVLKKLASDINVLGGGKAFFNQGGVINAQPSALGILSAESQLKTMQEAIVTALNNEKVLVPVDFLTEKMEKTVKQKSKLIR